MHIVAEPSTERQIPVVIGDVVYEDLPDVVAWCGPLRLWTRQAEHTSLSRAFAQIRSLVRKADFSREADFSQLLCPCFWDTS